MVKLALARKDVRDCYPLARTPVPALSNRLKAISQAGRNVDSCCQSHTTVGRAKRAEACTILSPRKSPFATGSPIKQNDRDVLSFVCFPFLHEPSALREAAARTLDWLRLPGHSP